MKLICISSSIVSFLRMLLRFIASVLSSRISPTLRRSFDIVATVVTAAAPWTIGAHEDKINDATNKVHNSITFFTITPCTQTGAVSN